MKIKELFETNSTQSFDAQALITEARKAGEKLFSSDRSGLIFTDRVKVMPLSEYLDQGDVEEDEEASYDTFDYLFRPPKDVADTPIKNGIIFIGGSDGVKLLTLPGVKVDLSNVPSEKRSHENSNGKLQYWKVTINGDVYSITDLDPIVTSGKVPPLPDTAKELKQAINKNPGKYGFSSRQKVSKAVKFTEKEIADDEKFRASQRY